MHSIDCYEIIYIFFHEKIGTAINFSHKRNCLYAFERHSGLHVVYQNSIQMDANKSELVLSKNSMFASDEQFSEDDLLDTNCGQAVTWLNDDENEKLDMSINIDATNMFFNRVESAEIIYQAKKKTCKMIGKYVMGDKLGEGKSLFSIQTFSNICFQS